MSEYGNPVAEKKFKTDEPVRHAYRWHEAWLAAVTRPGTATFASLLRDPNASANRGFRWIFITGSLGFVAQQAYLATHPRFAELFNPFNFAIGIAVVGVLAVLAFLISYGLLQFITQWLGGAGDHKEFFYTSATFCAPLAMLNVLLLPFSGNGSNALMLLNSGLAFYQLVLTAMALRAVNKISWLRAISAIILYFVTWTVIFFAVFGCFLSNATIR